MFWGTTPALDILEEYELLKHNIPETINILIVGGADCRHVLKTEACKYKHKNVKINFILVEACLEVIARQMLLLNIALQPQQTVGLSQKTKIFMEIYGNTLIRPSVAKFLQTTAIDLLKMITNYNYLKTMMDFLSLNVKYKERDYLETLLKFWSSKDEFDICLSWDRRLRRTLGVRYDSKIGAFDWDLHMRLHDVGARQICNQEYRNFRASGISFSWLESEVSKPNRSLVCAVVPNGANFVHHGYLGDMQTGPFISFGLTCEDETFLKSVYGQNHYRATDVTERNLKQIFYEIEHKKEYNHKKTNDSLMGNVVMKEENLVIDNTGLDFIPRPTKTHLKLEDKITLTSASMLHQFKHKQEYQNFFDVIYFGSTYLKLFDGELINNVAKKGAFMLIENQLYVPSCRKAELESFSKSIEETLTGVKIESVIFNYEKDDYAKIILK
ncbi:dynein axonemal assembly factor 3 homolog [Diabrotica virgifera virgifera]|uniref:Dynein assembly factor 3, axonemal homolog n=1 Tax=Diabrotica virgifera virgifera TaxID=50390 RepID=A0A6P7F868_DIAVI|nr:dynein axonemal assembly factor 3 homolog [Diabrotica virgifera virgifera]